MLGRIGKRFILQLLHGFALPATQVKSRGEVTRIDDAERVVERARQCESLAHPRRRTGRMTEQLQGPRGVHRARYARILTGPKCGRPIRAVLTRIVESGALFHMGERRVELTSIERHDAHGTVSREADGRVVGRIRDPQQARAQLTRNLELPPALMKAPEPEQHRKEPNRVSHLRAQLAGPLIGPRDLGRPVAPGRRQRRPEHDLQRQFLLNPLRRLRQCPEQVERLRRVVRGLAVRVLAQRVLARLSPIPRRPLVVPAALEMHGELSGDLARTLTVPALQALARPQMQSHPAGRSGCARRALADTTCE